LLVGTEWHCFQFWPGDVADCEPGRLAVDAGLLTRGPSSGVDCGVDPLTGDPALALLASPAGGAGGRG
jgi:hypothetical protein